MKQQMEEMLASQKEFQKNQQRQGEKLDHQQAQSNVFSELIDAQFKVVLVTNDEFRPVYHNTYWQELFDKIGKDKEQKINSIFNISGQALKEALQHPQQILLQQLNVRVLTEKESISDIQIVEHQASQKTFYSILTN